MSAVTKISGRSVLSYNEHNYIPHPLVVSSTFVGVEVELEDVWFVKEDAQTQLAYWEFHKEGSLRGKSAELVFFRPLAGIDIVTALEELERFVKKPKLSVRCSVHVHIDCLLLGFDALWSTILTALVCEPLLYHYCAGRKNNLFCLSSENNYVALLTMADEYIRLRRNGVDLIKTMRVFLGQWSRYTGINLNAIAKYGSLEYRMHGGAYKKTRLLNWINILLSIHKFASTNIFDIEKFPTEMSAIGPTELFERIWPDSKLQKLLTDRCRESVRSYMLQGIRNAQALRIAPALLNSD